MLLNKDHSLFILVDMQENTINSIYQHEQIIANCENLLIIANKLNIPIIVSEHVSDTAGHTISELKKFAADSSLVKSDFSLLSKIENKISPYQHVILVGIETHICVLQTAIEILETGKQVYVVANATGSRFIDDKEYALKRMQSLGIHIVTKEMVLYEWTRSSDHPEYKELCKKIIK